MFENSGVSFLTKTHNAKKKILRQLLLKEVQMTAHKPLITKIGPKEKVEAEGSLNLDELRIKWRRMFIELFYFWKTVSVRALNHFIETWIV